MFFSCLPLKREKSSTPWSAVWLVKGEKRGVCWGGGGGVGVNRSLGYDEGYNRDWLYISGEERRRVQFNILV